MAVSETERREIRLAMFDEIIADLETMTMGTCLEGAIMVLRAWRSDEADEDVDTVEAPT
jgi:hypothetical protein